MFRLGPVRAIVLCCLATLAAPLAGRAQEALPLPTPGKEAIRQALAEKTELDFVDQPLADVVEHLKQQHAIEIQLDRRAMEDAGLGSDTPITGKLKDISLRSVLRLVLGELDMTYVVRDGFLLLTTKTEAENMLVTQIYPVADLVAKSDFQPPTPRGRTEADYRALIHAIESTVATNTWQDVGGPGEIASFRNGDSLVISQTDDVHVEIAELLSTLRKTRDKQRAVAAAIARRAQPADDAVPEMRVKVYRLMPGAPGLGMGGLGIKSGGMGVMGGGMGGGMGLMNRNDDDADVALAEEQAADAKPDARPEAADQPQNDSPKPVPTAPPQPSAPLMFDPARAEAWASEIAKLLPEMIEPESWQPRGKGVARAAAGALVVRQTDEIHAEVSQLLAQIVPFRVAQDSSADASHKALLPPLATPGPQPNWPQEAEPRPAGSEADIEQALDGPAELDLTDQPLTNLVEMLGERYGIQAVLDRRALEDAGMGSDTPLTRHASFSSLRSALRLMLGELDLTYVIRDEVLVITTKTEAENMMVVKVYPVFDLAVRSGEGGGERSALDYRNLIQLIQSTAAPVTWQDVGGPGSMESFANFGALVVSQTTDVHEEIAQHLRALRDAAAAQRAGD